MKTILRGALCALTAFLLLFCAACDAQKPDVITFEAMDTVVSLTVYGDHDVGKQIQERITALDKEWDATDEESVIFRLNRDKTAAVGEDTADLLRRSLDLSRELDRSFDPTVYPAVLAWGFTTGDYRVPSDDELSRLSESIDYRKVTVDRDTVTLAQDAMIDPGAVGKGYAADLCSELLEDSDAQGAVLNLGGTVRLYGKKPDGAPFKVGIADPGNPAAFFGVISLEKGTVATSGGYERYFEQDGKRYIHILDPATAAPVDNGILSVTIVCDDGTAADALSTALFVMGADKAEDYYRKNPYFDFIILTDDGKLLITEGVSHRFSAEEGYRFKIQTIRR